jgi:hypothetical protein
MTGAPIAGVEMTVGRGEESTRTVKGPSTAGDGVTFTACAGGMVIGGGAW